MSLAARHLSISDEDAARSAAKLVLLLDFDNCLVVDDGVIAQMTASIHSYCEEKYGLSSAECDRLYRSHGTTIKGLSLSFNASHLQGGDSGGNTFGDAEFRSYYKEIYSRVPAPAREHQSNGDVARRERLAALLSSLKCTKIVASNSPSEWYIERMLVAYGLDGVGWADVITPDKVEGWHSKASDAYWELIHARWPSSAGYRVVLLDDSRINVSAAARAGIEAHLVTREWPIERAIRDCMREQRLAVTFTAPKQVAVQRRMRETRLPHGTVDIECVASLISSGTELKFYRGDFDDDGPVDENISAIGESSAKYPLDYGYSLCGRVARIGEGVPPNMLGKLCFAFHPHASHAVVAAEDVEARDATYLPSVETAISIVHDVHPRFGESVAIFGQGLIGLLVTKVLSSMGIDVVAVDLIPERRAKALVMGAREAVSPQDIAAAAPDGGFDACVEVTGNPKALQACIDGTRRGGKVVVASWYSASKPISLTLGTAFHRSHVTIIASQVSSLCGSVTATWDKQRRFDAAWKFLAKVQPSKLLTTRAFSVAEAASAYERLDAYEQVACELEYSND